MSSLITVVCKKAGCNSKFFNIKTQIESRKNSVIIRCIECDTKRLEIPLEKNIKISSKCGNCDDSKYGIKKDTDSNKLYLTCANCGNPTTKQYVDDEGNEIDFKDYKILKLENKIDELVYRLDELESQQNDMYTELYYKANHDISDLKSKISDLEWRVR